MKQLNDGGSAFPGSYTGQNGVPIWSDGMSLRDYFAAHAPEAPDFFKQKFDKPEPFPEYELWFTGAQKDEAKEKATWEWIHERDMQNIIQWPFYYADALLKARESNHAK